MFLLHLKLVEGNSFKPLFADSPLVTGFTRSQDQASILSILTAHLYFLSVRSLKNKNVSSIYTDAVPYESTTKFYVDIDNQKDFEIAKQIADFY